MSSPASALAICAACGEETSFVCAACLKTCFCSRPCAAKAWAGHRAACAEFSVLEVLPIDALAHFDGSARWVREPRLEVSGEANVYTAEPVDFHALAEKAGDWRVMDADIAGLDAELGAIDTELEALSARLPSTSN